jgi:hypothetical protein
MKKELTVDRLKRGQLLVVKKSSTGYNAFEDEVYIYLKPCIEEWGYTSKNIINVLNVQSLIIHRLGLAHLRKA